MVAAYGRILPPSILELPPLGCINVHASLLPRFRGASPIAHALLEGDTETGVSIMRLEEGLDTGPVFAQRATPIPEDATTGSLTVQLSQLGAQLLIEVLPKICSGALKARAQAEQGITYAPLLSKADGALDFRQPAQVLERQVRAFNPWPSTFALLGDQRIQVLAAQPAPLPTETSGSSPGLILAANAQGVLVACGERALRLTELKPAGKKAMPAQAWIAGRGVRPGEQFELPKLETQSSEE